MATININYLITKTLFLTLTALLLSCSTGLESHDKCITFFAPMTEYDFIERELDFDQKLKDVDIDVSEVRKVVIELEENFEIKFERDTGAFKLYFTSKALLTNDKLKHYFNNIGHMKQEFEGIKVFKNGEKTSHKGSGFSCGYRTRNDSVILYYTMDYNNSFHKADKIDVQGVFNISCITGYHYAKMLKHNTGKKFSIDQQQYKLIDVFDDKVIIERLGKSFKDDEKLDFEIYNVSLDEKTEYSGKGLLELPMKNWERHMEAKHFLPKKIYHAFRKNNTLSEREHDKLKEKVKKSKKKSVIYACMKLAAPVEKMIIYKPHIGAKKSITINISN